MKSSVTVLSFILPHGFWQLVPPRLHGAVSYSNEDGRKRRRSSLERLISRGCTNTRQVSWETRNFLRINLRCWAAKYTNCRDFASQCHPSLICHPACVVVHSEYTRLPLPGSWEHVSGLSFNQPKKNQPTPTHVIVCRSKGAPCCKVNEL